MTAALLSLLGDAGWQVAHVDTSDHRGIENVGRFDLGNVVLALHHSARFMRTLLRTRPDIVYLPLSQGVAGFARDAVLLIAARSSAAQIVVHAHGGQYQEFYRRMPTVVRGLMRLALARVRLIIVLAEVQRRQFDGWAPPSTRVEVIPNGAYDEWPFGGQPPRPHEGGTVLFLGNLHLQKGFLDLLDAVPTVLRSVPHTSFVFAGSPPRDPVTEALVKDRLRDPAIKGATAFVGVVRAAERRRLLEAADILVFPPRWNEGQPLVALEAMSAGLPIVATASGGLAETVRDGVEAMIVPRADPAAIAHAVIELLLHPELRTSMGAAARTRFQSEYTLDRWGRRMLAALELVGGASVRGSPR